MSRERLARTAGIATKTLWRVENGVGDRPRTATLERLAEALEVTLDELLGAPDPERLSAIEATLAELGARLDGVEALLDGVEPLQSVRDYVEQTIRQLEAEAPVGGSPAPGEARDPDPRPAEPARPRARARRRS